MTVFLVTMASNFVCYWLGVLVADRMTKRELARLHQRIAAQAAIIAGLQRRLERGKVNRTSGDVSASGGALAAGFEGNRGASLDFMSDYAGWKASQAR